MPCSTPLTGARLTLTESIWLIHPCDAYAAIVVNALADAMSLPSIQFQKNQGESNLCQRLRVYSDPALRSLACAGNGFEQVLCQVPSSESKDHLVFGMLSIADAILRAELLRGGLLIHGALAKTPPPQEGGIILAGPGHVGKTTASNRLPLPWSSFCDDATLVIRDGQQRYWAHPWPTWSRFFSTPDGIPGPGGKWDVARRLPLQAIFFLAQAEKDRIAPIPFTPALTYLMETVQQVSWPVTIRMPIDQARDLQQLQFTEAEALVRTFPPHKLHFSLTGTFWKQIEETLNASPARSSTQPWYPNTSCATPGPEKIEVRSVPFDDTLLTVNYYGSSMIPTLRHPDLLEILPYTEPVRTGDIVYFNSPVDGRQVVHRVVRITPSGFRTRGDNNSAVDLYLLQQQDIIGQVAAAWRHGRRRKIAGGFRGNCSGYYVLLKRRIERIISLLLHGTYHGLATSGFPRCLLPASCRPRVFEFKQQHLPPILKLVINGRVIGRYDAWNRSWEIDRPWRLIINVSKLPVVTPSPAMNISDLNTTALASPEQQCPP